MKKTIISLSLALALGITACDNKLDIEPRQSVDSATALASAQDIESALIGAYGVLSGTGGGLADAELYGTNLLLLPDLLASDNYVDWRGSFASYREVTSRQMLATNAEAQRTWITAYQVINVANNILGSLDKVTNADDKTAFEGEAHFLRGIMYFELVRLFGLPWGATAANDQPGVPIVLRATLTQEQAAETKARNTVAEVYAQVLADLTKAAELMPEDNGLRANRFAALGFLSRVYLQQSDYAKALAAANEVIESGNYQLNNDVTTVFRNKNTAESVFEIQENTQNNPGTSNDGLTTFYASLPAGEAVVGRGDVQVLNAFVESYAPTDKRRTALFYIGFKGNGTRYYTGKWADFYANIPVIRLAELLLTRAECNLRLASATGATPAQDLNAVRVRAGVAPIAAPTLADVLKERNQELAFEGQRIHDIKRTKGKTGSLNWNDPKLVMPIPKREVDANSQLVQNPGY
ncbi:SusD-like starch-binding protein associating with outer membrane [Larkinella arboricola]|uniref:SusD-like starch-binding protein associating with outer membrane n=1 Tax=Larkinella arboricola TaxID=643671 RepID=A0A327WSW6_LARAB|nr:RagB/SusD family nutrient uptake outer membrane protein [Larkinella arboricola]RAJ94412.1 SusD-like starch-binding protein associating with outer membrane [Larkinella arboricola]